jgi:topoisomerase IV subunit A
MAKKKNSKKDQEQPELPLNGDPEAAPAKGAAKPAATTVGRAAQPVDGDGVPAPAGAGSGPPARRKPGKVQEDGAPLAQHYRTWFLDYASYVILDRAVPHIDDGLKPV